MGLAEYLLYMQFVLCDWYGDRGGVDGLVEVGGGGGCYNHQSVFVVSLSFPLSGSPFCCFPVHSVVSLSILLAPYPFSYLPVHSVVSLSILLFYREEAKVRGRIRTEVVNFWSVVFTGIVFHGRYHRSIFNKVCLICPSDVLFKQIMSQIFYCASRNLLLNCLQPKNNQKMTLTDKVPVA